MHSYLHCHGLDPEDYQFERSYAVNVVSHLSLALRAWNDSKFSHVFFYLWTIWVHMASEDEDGYESVEALYKGLCEAFPVEGRRYTAFGSSLYLPALAAGAVPGDSLDMSYWTDNMTATVANGYFVTGSEGVPEVVTARIENHCTSSVNISFHKCCGVDSGFDLFQCVVSRGRMQMGGTELKGCQLPD